MFCHCQYCSTSIKLEKLNELHHFWSGYADNPCSSSDEGRVSAKLNRFSGCSYLRMAKSLTLFSARIGSTSLIWSSSSVIFYLWSPMWPILRSVRIFGSCKLIPAAGGRCLVMSWLAFCWIMQTARAGGLPGYYLCKIGQDLLLLYMKPIQWLTHSRAERAGRGGSVGLSLIAGAQVSIGAPWLCKLIVPISFVLHPYCSYRGLLFDPFP